MKCSHTESDDMPEFLCRACHPELNMTPSRRAELDAADRDRAEAKAVVERRERELRRTEAKLENLTKRGDLDPTTVGGKIAASLRKKVDRLQIDGLTGLPFEDAA